MRRADRDLRQRRGDADRPARRRLAGLCPAAARAASLVDRAYGQPPDLPHQENFVQCLRSRKPPAADVAEGHLSALLVHYANISYRTGGQKLHIDPKSDEILDNPAAMALFRRSYRKPWVVEG